MNNLDKKINWKIYSAIVILIILILSILIFIFTLDVKKHISAILEVDDDKNLYLLLNSSNIQQIHEEKHIYLSIEGKNYLIDNIELFSQGNNRYIVKFDNEELFDLLKSKSVYNVTILIKGSKLIQTIFT